jgi:hypothetical protein
MVGNSAVASASPPGKAAGAPLRKTLREGIHVIDAETYHQDPAPKPSLSSHLAAVLLNQSPSHAAMAHPRLNADFVEDRDPRFDLGRAAHALMLEGSAIFEIIDAPNWKFEAARDERQAVSRAGKVALLEHEWAQVSAMVKSARAQLRQTADAYSAFRDGEAERTLIWQDDETKIWCRARLDWLQRKRGFVFDYKTTAGSASPKVWSQRQLPEIAADIQAAFYVRGLKKLLGREFQFRFICQEVAPPYAVSVVGLSPAALEIAAMDVQAAIDLWRACQRRQKWPGYPTRTFFAEAPAWRQKDQQDRYRQRQVDRDAKVDAFKLAIQLWRP